MAVRNLKRAQVFLEMSTSISHVTDHDFATRLSKFEGSLDFAYNQYTGVFAVADKDFVGWTIEIENNGTNMAVENSKKHRFD